MKLRNQLLTGLIALACLLAAWAGAQAAPLPIVLPPSDGGIHPVRLLALRVASPRATLVPARPRSAEATACTSVGAAHNFARPDLRVVLREGSILEVRLSEETEGVWYPATFGLLGTFLVLELQDPEAPSEWVLLGWDGASDVRQGPSVGVARDVRTRFEASETGTFRLRARVLTYALPLRPETPGYLWPCADDAVDSVIITVHVVGLESSELLAVPGFTEPALDLPHAVLD